MTTEPLTPDAALVRLRQYGERTQTWSTATYNNGAENALHQIATTLGAEVDRLRVELDQWRAQRNGLAEANLSLNERLNAVGEARLKAENEARVKAHEIERLRAELAAADTSIVCDAEGHAIPHSPNCPDARTERDRWQALADALNAVNAVGIDLDGTLTDHATHSVVWDRDATRWVLANCDD